MEVVYFELNNWMPGRDYPEAEPFIEWMSNDLKQQFEDEEWIKENKLVVVESLIDMSVNYCVTAPKEWVEKNCSELLAKYEEFLRVADEVPVGRFGCPFLEWSEENTGFHFADEVYDSQYHFSEYIIQEKE